MKKLRNGKLLVLLIVGLLFLPCRTVFASEEIQIEQIEEVLKDVLPDVKVTFRDLLSALLSEEDKLEVDLLKDYIADSFFYILKVNKGTISYLLMFAITASVVTNFSNVFQNKQVSETGFYMIYMLMLIVCLQSFLSIFQMIQESMDRLLVFMRVLSPVYFLSMSISTGKISSVAFYSLMLLLIYLIELVILNGLFPAAHVYFMVRVLNVLSPEMYLSKLSELIELLMSWILKTLLAGVTGVGILQGLLAPAADTAKRGAISKVVNLLPGVGDLLGVGGEMMLSTAVFLKNGIGMAGSILLLLMCLFPVLNMGILVVIYKGIAAIIQPISDKRVVEMMDAMGETYRMLLKIIVAVLFLFLLAIGLSAAFTS